MFSNAFESARSRVSFSSDDSGGRDMASVFSAGVQDVIVIVRTKRIAGGAGAQLRVLQFLQYLQYVSQKYRCLSSSVESSRRTKR